MLAWIVVLSVNIFLFEGYFGGETDIYGLYFNMHMPIWVIYLLVFYINYLFFIPKLLNSGKIKQYIAVSVATILLGVISVQLVRISDGHMVRASKFAQVLFGTEEQQRSFFNDKHKDRMLKAIEPLNIPDSTKKEVVKKIIDSYKIPHRRDPNRVINNRDDWHRRLEKQLNLKNMRNVSQLYFILLLYLSSLILGYAEKSIQRRRDMERMRREKIESELAFLKGQINPHFLFNALNSIYSLVLPHSDIASDAVLKLASILRYMLCETTQKEVSLDKEIDIVRDYIAMQKLKFNDTTTIDFKVTGNTVGYSIEPLIILPFLENAFKYGADNITPSFITTDIDVINENFILTVKNKIVVRGDSVESSGIGIKNVKRRLELLYSKRYKLDIIEESDTFSVYLKIKL